MSLILFTAKYLVIDLLGEAVRFPFWWYSAGAKKAAVFCWQNVVNIEEELALKVWVVNIFKPMFGQYDWQGKIISFFIRLVQIIFRSVIMLVVLVFFLLLFLSWLVLPIFIIYQIIISFK
ncbi:MAG: hypothetical protein V1684_01825 [bacterium]